MPINCLKIVNSVNTSLLFSALGSRLLSAQGMGHKDSFESNNLFDYLKL